MSLLPVIWHPNTVSDLSTIRRVLAQKSPRHAAEFGGDLLRVIKSLQKKPDLGESLAAVASVREFRFGFAGTSSASVRYLQSDKTLVILVVHSTWAPDFIAPLGEPLVEIISEADPAGDLFMLLYEAQIEAHRANGVAVSYAAKNPMAELPESQMGDQLPAHPLLTRGFDGVDPDLSPVVAENPEAERALEQELQHRLTNSPSATPDNSPKPSPMG